MSDQSNQLLQIVFLQNSMINVYSINQFRNYQITSNEDGEKA